MRRFLATVLQLGIAAGTIALLLLQRYVAEIDDEAERRVRDSDPRIF